MISNFIKSIFTNTTRCIDYYKGLIFTNTFYKFDLTYTDFEAYSADSSAGNKVEAELLIYEKNTRVE